MSEKAANTRHVTYDMLVTEIVFHALSGWSKTEAPANMASIRSTVCIAHPPTGWLKLVAPRNLSKSRDIT